MVSSGGSSSDAIISSTIATSGCSRRTTPSLHCEPARPGQLEAEVVVRHDLVADHAIGANATDVRQEHPRLARHVGTHVPRVRTWVERDVGAVVDVLHPAGFGLGRGLDRVEAARGEIGDGVRDPIAVLLDRHRHVREHRRASGARDGEEVREPDGHQAEVRGRAVHPLLLQREAVATGDVDRDQRAGHRIEAGRVDDGVELERLTRGVDPGLGDRRERILPEVDEPDVRQVVGLEVARVEARPLGAERVVLGAQRLRRRRVVSRSTRIFSRIISATMSFASGLTAWSAKMPRMLNSSPAAYASSKRARRSSSETIAAVSSSELDGDAATRQLRLVAVGGAVGFESRETVGRRGAVVRGDRERRRALEHRQLRGLRGDERDGLHARRPGADDRDSLPREVDAFVRPTAGEVHLAAEAIGTLDVDLLGHRQAAGRHHVEATRQFVAACRCAAARARPLRPTQRRRHASRSRCRAASRTSPRRTGGT